MFNITATTFHGLEEVLAKEITQLGGADVEIARRAVTFRGDQTLLYRANLELRTALRILLPIYEFKAKTPEIFYKKIQEIDWSDFISAKDTLAVDAVVHSQTFKHSQYMALKTKDAIVDQFRDRFYRRPNVNTISPHLRVNVLIQNEYCLVSVDTSGESLHKRGYRVDGYLAPLNEVLAAGLILRTGWDGKTTFIDPMCGSGTLLTEAALLATNTPPQLNRAYFAFKKLSNFDETLWNQVLNSAKSKIQPAEGKILGFDKAFQAVRTAQVNLEKAGMSPFVTVERRAFERNTAPINGGGGNGVMILNPPYGERIETSADILDFYKMMGERLHQEFQGFQAWIISSNDEAMQLIGLKPSQELTLYNGALPCKFQQYDL